MAGRLLLPFLSLLSLSLLAAAKPDVGFSVSRVGNGGLSASQAGVGLGIDDFQDIQVSLRSIMRRLRRNNPCLSTLST